MSDDNRVWRRGNDELGALAKIATESPEHKKLFDEYHNYGWRKGPQPQKPMTKAFRTGESDDSG